MTQKIRPLDPDFENPLSQLVDETAAAYQAFTDYLALGPMRSHTQLMDKYKALKASGHPVPTTRVPTIETWSARNRWIERCRAYDTGVSFDKADARRKRMDKFEERMWILAEKIVKNIEDTNDRYTMMAEEVVYWEDGTDENGSPIRIKIVEKVVNTGDLKNIAQAFGTVGKDLKRMLGLPDVVSVKQETKNQGTPTMLRMTTNNVFNINVPDPTAPQSAETEYDAEIQTVSGSVARRTDTPQLPHGSTEDDGQSEARHGGDSGDTER